MRALITAVVGGFTRSALNGSGAARKLMALALGAVDDRMRVVTAHGTFTVRVTNPLERWRAETLLTKEPETIRWLDATVTHDSVFYDVGANIGLYTLYACHLAAGARAVCFEPEALNFARLNRNLHDNGLSGRALAFSVGLGRSTGIHAFLLSVLEAGRALHGDRFVASGAEAHRQGIAVLALDEVRRLGGEVLAPPTHLKIDVDGPELDVLAGAATTLAQPNLRHVLVESAPDQTAEVHAVLEAAGFRLAERGAEAADGTNLIFARG